MSEPGQVKEVSNDQGAETNENLSEPGQLKEVSNDQGAETKEWCFHNNHGSNIRLSNNKRTAEKIRRCDYEIILSENALEENVLHEVRIDETDDRFNSNTMVGVMTECPDTVTLPFWPPSLKSAMIVSHKYLWINTEKSPDDTFSALYDVKVGSRVGVFVDSNSCLHVTLDGRDLGIAAGHTPVLRPAYAVFSCFLYLRKMTTQPLRKMTL